MGYKILVDLEILDMVDSILEMSKLFTHYAILDCHSKVVTIAMLGMSRLERKENQSPTSRKIISYILYSYQKVSREGAFDIFCAP